MLERLRNWFRWKIDALAFSLSRVIATMVCRRRGGYGVELVPCEYFLCRRHVTTISVLGWEWYCCRVGQ